MDKTKIEKRVLGRTGLPVSVLGFGGAEIGYEQTQVKTVELLLASALDAGLNVSDTAECYIDSEELIGNAVSHRRSEYYLFTKCGHSSGLNYPDWHPKLLTESINRSLKRLKTDYLDLVQLHSCSAEVLGQGEVIEVLQRARDEGKTRFIGYSGDSADALYAINSGAFDTLQTSVNIADQEALELTLPLAHQHGMGVIAKRPLANAVWRHQSKPENPYVHQYWERLRKLDYDFLKTGFSEAIGISLRFTLSIAGVHTAIVGTTKSGRWIENAKLLSQGALSPQEFDAIRTQWKKVAEPNWTGEV
jgi:aryl-alcohol dehydrogenase-like predicted oxidoreductase